MIVIGLLFVFGLFFMVAEVLFPSLGAFGLAAAACSIGADILAYNQYGGLVLAGMIAIQVVAGPLLLRFAFRLLPRLGIGRAMILPAAPADPAAAIERAEHLVGVEGEAVTDLRPSGTARFGAERRSVVAEADQIDAGTRVRVTAVEGFRIVVRAIADPAPSPSASR
jgi:membrane-bound serine protease (ClpP class)